ncbi:MAG: zinc ABC transporter substrate-binding protein [Candidatus Latescibacterota bacterium]|nr:zinc ABC transporter substrate-binding protein [Candidatus Latescibacterota bacterium]
MVNILFRPEFKYILFAFFSIFIFSCTVENTDRAPTNISQLEVVCTTGMVADLAKKIGGNRVNVIGLMGPGVDPHYYKASQGDLKKLEKAHLVLYNGLFLEGKMESLFTQVGQNKRVVAVASNLPEDRLLQPPEFEGNFDPHVWFDVELWSGTIDVVVTALVSVDPEGTEIYRKNGEIYLAELRILDDWVANELSTIPSSRRVLVTAHDAFGYFGQAYGIEVVGLQGISTVAEYGVNDVTQLVDLIVSRQIPAMFVESSVPERSIKAVQQGCIDRGHSVIIGGTLYSDAMGGVGSNADTYVGMVEENVRTIVSALK